MKQRFTIWVVVCGTIFFFVNFTLPFILFVPGIFFGFTGQAATHTHALTDRAAFWNGQWWYLEEVEKIGPTGAPKSSVITLKSLPVSKVNAPVKLKSTIPVPVLKPALLAGEGGLWIIGADQVGLYRSGTMEFFKPQTYLGNFSNPFFYKGVPAVLEQSPAGLSLKTFEDGQWVTGPSLNLAYHGAEDLIYYVKALSEGEKALLFTALDGHLHYQEILPNPLEASDDRWTGGEEVSEYWDVFFQGGVLHFATCDGPCAQGKIKVFREEHGIWNPSGSYELGMAFEQLSVYPGSAPNSFLVAVMEADSSMARLFEAGEVSIFPKAAFVGSLRKDAAKGLEVMDVLSLVAQLITLLASVAFLFAIDWLVKKYKEPVYVYGELRLEYASILRRAAAKLLDSLIIVALLAAGGFTLVYPVWNEPNGAPGVIFGLIGLSAVVLLAGWLGFSFLEGKYGQTPGKRLAGIQVLKVDLAPCGFGRALLRNLLILIDSFSSYAVGIITLALTERRQRIGDLAAKTVVVRK